MAKSAREKQKVHCPHCNCDVLADRFVRHLRKIHAVVDGKFLPFRRTAGFYRSGRQPGTVQGGQVESDRRKH